MNTKPLLACGVVTGPLFVAPFLVEGTIRADYDPLRHPVSSLLLVPSGRAQTANFMVADLLTLAFAVGLYLALRPGKGSVWGPFWWGYGRSTWGGYLGRRSR